MFLDHCATMADAETDSDLFRIAIGGYQDICIETAQLITLPVKPPPSMELPHAAFSATPLSATPSRQDISATPISATPSRPAIPAGVFSVPTFSERFHGLSHDMDITSSFVAFPAFVVHSLTCIRLASIILYATASLPAAIRRRGSIMEPFIDLAMRFNLLARGLDRGSYPTTPPAGAATFQYESSWHMIISGIFDISSWWEKQGRAALGEFPASPTQEFVHGLRCMSDLNALCRDMLHKGVLISGFKTNEWVFLNLLCSSLVAESARMLAAAGTIAATHLLDIPNEQNENQRRIWKTTWDANMYGLRKVHSYATLTSTSQYDGIGAHEEDPTHKVYMPTFDGTLSAQLLGAIDHIVSAKSKGPISFAHIETLSTPIPVAAVGEMTAFDYCRRGFLIMLMRFGDVRQAEERVPLALRNYIPVMRWDVLVTGKGTKEGPGGGTHGSSEGLVDVEARPEWTPMSVCVREEEDSVTKFEYPHGAVHLTAHLVEFIRPVAFPYRHKPKRKFDAQVRTYIVNPATWGPLGSLREKETLGD